MEQVVVWKWWKAAVETPTAPSTSRAAVSAWRNHPPEGKAGGGGAGGGGEGAAKCGRLPLCMWWQAPPRQQLDLQSIPPGASRLVRPVAHRMTAGERALHTRSSLPHQATVINQNASPLPLLIFMLITWSYTLQGGRLSLLPPTDWAPKLVAVTRWRSIAVPTSAHSLPVFRPTEPWHVFPARDKVVL